MNSSSGSSASGPRRASSFRLPPRLSTWANNSWGVHRSALAAKSDKARKASPKRLLRKRVPQGSLAVPGQLEQLFLGQADQRSLQHGGQGQIVLGQQQTFRQRHQIHHGQLLGQHHAVRARHRHAETLQAFDQLIDEAAAPAHQHQNVAGGNRPSFRVQLFAALNHAVDARRHQAGQTGARIVAFAPLHGRLPRFVLVLGLRFDRRSTSRPDRPCPDATPDARPD